MARTVFWSKLSSKMSQTEKYSVPRYWVVSVYQTTSNYRQYDTFISSIVVKDWDCQYNNEKKNYMQHALMNDKIKIFIHVQSITNNTYRYDADALPFCSC